MTLTHGRWLLVVVLGVSAARVVAQFDPTKVPDEPVGIAARFADPTVQYATPGFRPGRADFPAHAEVMTFLTDLARSSAHVTVETMGQSQRGLPMPLVILSGAGGVKPDRPTVLVLGQQHGNEPAGGEAALALAAQLAGPRSAMLDRVNVLIVPRANPDGAERFVRATASGVDVNRDHLLLQTPEARAIAAITLRYKPQVVLDLHEFTVGGRWIDKFGGVEKYDALLQAAAVGNLDPAIADASERDFVDPVRQALSGQGLLSFPYHTASGDAADKTVSMGGVQPDTGRNVSGLRPAVSMLIEVRGVGIGRAHFLRRVHTQVTAALTVVERAASEGRHLIELVHRAEVTAAAAACSGTLVVEAQHTSTRRQMTFLDARTGADLTVDVDWRAAAPLEVLRSRPRPCGYLVSADQSQALDRLRLLGVRVQPVTADATWDLEHYILTSEDNGQRQDARGAIEDGQPIRVLRVRTEPARERVGAGTVYVPLDQPLSPLIAAALEPDSQNSYAANHLLALDAGRLRRVIQRPNPAALRASR